MTYTDAQIERAARAFCVAYWGEDVSRKLAGTGNTQAVEAAMRAALATIQGGDDGE